MKRTAEIKPTVLSNYSVVRFTDSLSRPDTFPAMNRWAIFNRPLTRTQNLLLGEATFTLVPSSKSSCLKSKLCRYTLQGEYPNSTEWCPT